MTNDRHSECVGEALAAAKKIGGSVARLAPYAVTVERVVGVSAFDAVTGAPALLEAALKTGAAGWVRRQSKIYWFEDGRASVDIEDATLGATLFAQWRNTEGASVELGPDIERPGCFEVRTLRRRPWTDGESLRTGERLLLQQMTEVLFAAPSTGAPAKLRYVVFWGAALDAEPSALTRLHHWFDGFVYAGSSK